MAEQWSVSILGRNEIDCHGFHGILSNGGFNVVRCLPDNDGVGFHDWEDEAHHIIIVDNASPSEAIQRCGMLRTAMERVRIVLMSEEYDLATIREAFASGVDGILARQIASKPLISAMQLIALGQKVMPSQVVQMLAADSSMPSHAEWLSHSSLAHLSVREIDILACLVAGESNKAIALKLSVAEATVKAHVKAILRKLQLENRTQAAIWAVSRWGADRAVLGDANDPPVGAAGTKTLDHHPSTNTKEHIWRS